MLKLYSSTNQFQVISTKICDFTALEVSVVKIVVFAWYSTGTFFSL